MNIYILEDDIYHQNRLQEVIREISKYFGMTLDIKLVTGKPEELLSRVTTYGKDDVYFLDIEIKGQEKKGLEVAKKIREEDDQATIIFVTTHTEFAPITYFYQVAALGFVDKELDTSEFTKDIAKYIEVLIKRNAMKPEDIFEVRTQTRHVRIPFDEICLIETTDIPHKLVLLADNRRLEFYESIKKIEKEEPRLFRAHKAFLINPNKVIEVDREANIVYFAGGLECLIARRKVKPLLQLLGEK